MHQTSDVSPAPATVHAPRGAGRRLALAPMTVAALVAMGMLAGAAPTLPGPTATGSAPHPIAGAPTRAEPVVLRTVSLQSPFQGFPVSEADSGAPAPKTPTGQAVRPQPVQPQPAPKPLQAQPVHPQPAPKPSQPQPAQQIKPPADPCLGVADPSKLIARPDPLHLAPGASKGSFAIYNCGQEEITWSARTKPTVALSKKSGTLAGGAKYLLSFTVDKAAFPAGAYLFRIKVSQPGHNVYVDVHGATHPGASGPQGGLIVPPPGPSRAPGNVAGNGGKPAGCGAGCITRAWLTPSPSTADLALEVKTHTAAKITAIVGTQAPQGAGAQIPDPAVTASTGTHYRTQWTTTLTPLQHGTTYHIVVRAKDSKGYVSTQVGSFTTTKKPASGLSAGAPGGCAANCVKSALLTPDPVTPGAGLAVRTHVPAKMFAYVGDAEPQRNSDGQPYFPGASPAAASGGDFRTSWTANLKLPHSTTYHVILKVTDEQYHHQFLTAKITAPPAPTANHHNRVVVTFHKIHVSDDADNQPLNRTGELRFLFAVNGEYHPELDVGKRKVRAPEWISLDDGNRFPGRSVVVENAPDLLWIRVQGWEHDRKDRKPLCQAAGDQPPLPWPSSPPLKQDASGRTCDDEVEWNSAAAAIDLHPEADPDATLPPCHGFGNITGDICVILRATGDDPRFDVYVTVDFVD